MLNKKENLPTDVQDTEMKEICEIAKMFKAEQIYETGIQFVHRSIDQNFNVPDDKYDDINGDYLILVCENHTVHHEGNLNDLEFADKSSEEKIANNEKDNSKEIKIADLKSKEPQKQKPKSVIYQVRSEKHSLRCTKYHF